MKILLLTILLIHSLAGLAGTNSMTELRFLLDARHLPEGTKVGLRGNVEPLSWFKSMEMKPSGTEMGKFELIVPFQHASDQWLEFKFVIEGKPVTFENLKDNRVAFLDQQSQVVESVWNLQQNILSLHVPPLNAYAVSQEMDLLVDALKSLHPGLYRYRSADQMDSMITSIKESLSEQVRYSDLFLYYSKLTAFFQCGHTFPSFFNQKALINQLIIRSPDKLPFSFKVVEDRMLLRQSAFFTDRLKPGTEILQINQVPVSEILENVSKLIKSDGGNPYKIKADLNLWADGSAEAFDVYFPLLYPNTKGQFLISYQTEIGKTEEEIVVAALTPLERKRLIELNYPNQETQTSRRSLSFENENTAYLRMSTFDGFILGIDWKAYLKKTFKQIHSKKVSTLILDLRGNEGGQDEIILYLGKCLNKNTMQLPVKETKTRFERVPDRFRPYISTWDTSFYDLRNQTERIDSTFYRLKQSTIQKVKPWPFAFDGKLYVLVDGSNSSASLILAEAIKENNMGTLVGEPTGGSLKGLNSGIIFFLRLPYSKIEVDLPILGTFTPNAPKGGLIPEIRIDQNVEDTRKGIDTQLEGLKKRLKRL